MKKRVLIIILIAPLMSFAQTIQERTSFDDGYLIKTYNDELVLLSTEKYINDNLVEAISVNPDNGFYEGRFFDGQNEFTYDKKSQLSAKDLVISAGGYGKFTSEYDEINIHNLELIDGRLNGVGYIVGYVYPKSRSYDAVGTYYMSNAMGFKSPQYTYSTFSNAPPLKTDTIGHFTLNDGIYQGSAKLNLSNYSISVNFSDYGTPVSYHHQKNDGSVSDFNVQSKFYKINGELFFTPSIKPSDHSFTRLTEKLFEVNGNMEAVKKYTKYPFIEFDFLNGKIGIINKDLKVASYFDENGYYKDCMQLFYYDSTGVYFTAIQDGITYLQEHPDSLWGDDNRVTYGSYPIPKWGLDYTIPKYYYKINVNTSILHGYRSHIKAIDLVQSNLRFSADIDNYLNPEFKTEYISTDTERRTTLWQEHESNWRDSVSLKNYVLRKGLNQEDPESVERTLVALNSELTYLLLQPEGKNSLLKIIKEEEALISNFLHSKLNVSDYSERVVRAFAPSKDLVSTYRNDWLKLPARYYLSLTKYEDGQLKVYTPKELTEIVDSWVSLKVQLEKSKWEVESGAKVKIEKKENRKNNLNKAGNGIRKAGRLLDRL